jgi:hypothetical protein
MHHTLANHGFDYSAQHSSYYRSVYHHPNGDRAIVQHETSRNPEGVFSLHSRAKKKAASGVGNMQLLYKLKQWGHKSSGQDNATGG